MMSKLQAVFAYIKRHKFMSVVAALIVLYGLYAFLSNGEETEETRYVLAVVERDTITESVSGTGQVTSTSEIEMSPKVSGDIESIAVIAGDFVEAGDIIAQLDATEARKVVRDAQLSYENAQISYEKLVEPASALDITKAENDLVRAREDKTQAEKDLSESYEDAFNDVTDTFNDLPSIVEKVDDLLHDKNSYIHNNELWRYRNGTKALKDDAILSYDQAQKQYDDVVTTYTKLERSSDPEEIAALLDDARETTRALADSVKDVLEILEFVKDDLDQGTTLTTLQNDITTLSNNLSQTNTHVETLTGAARTIDTNKEAIVDADRSIVELNGDLEDVRNGADELDRRSEELNVEERRNALRDAQADLADYTIRAPFDGLIADIEGVVSDRITSGSVIATLITEEKVAEITLNEIDIKNVAPGQKATITFDALEDVTQVGEVVSIDQVGTVSSGVVNFDVQISFDGDDTRIRPGMTVSASIVTDTSVDTIVVPNSAVTSRGSRDSVQVFPGLSGDTIKESATTEGITSPQPPERRAVELGVLNDFSSEITSGLSVGDIIVVRTTNASEDDAANQAPSLFGGGGRGSRGLR